MHLKDFMSFEDFKKVCEYTNKVGAVEDKGKDYYQEICEKHYHQPILAFLSKLRDNNQLSKIKNSEGHLTRMSNRWNLFLEGKKDKYERGIEDVFDKVAFYQIRIDKDTTPTEVEYLALYEKFTDMFTAGNLSSYLMPEDACACVDCAQRMHLSFEGWQPKYEVWAKKADGSLDYRNYIEPESCLSKDIVEIGVSFPTGELLVADWIRIPEFTKLVEGEDKWADTRSLNHTKGRINNTKGYVELFNFVCVSLGNSSPNVYLHKGNLTVGNPHRDRETGDDMKVEKGFRKVADVCTDFWGTTIIDKQQLIYLLLPELGDKAEQTVEDYITAQRLKPIQVKPGSYTLKFHGNSEDFDKKIKALDEKNIAKNSESQENGEINKTYERITTPSIDVSFMLTPNLAPKKKLKM